jgi:heme/copper-type cytochrome/quinol oxidase subunit 2
MIAQDRTQADIDTQLHHLHHVTVITTIATVILTTVITTITIIVFGIRGDITAMVDTTTDLSVIVTIVIDISIVFLDTTFMVVLTVQQGLK